jgi:hypothetical protein
MALTDTALKALKPKQKAYVVSDDRSLYAEVLPTGAIVWRFRYRLNGKREKLTLGKYPALTLKNARLKRDEAAQLVAMGESPAQKKQRDKIAGPEDTTVAQFAERFFKDIQERDRQDNTMPRRYLEKDIVPHIGDKPVKALTAEGRARRYLEEEGTGLRRCCWASARTSQAHAGLRDDVWLDQSQSGECAPNASRL